MSQCRRRIGGVFVRVLAEDAQYVCRVNEEHLPQAVVESQAAVIRRDERSVATSNEADADDSRSDYMPFLASRRDCS